MPKISKEESLARRNEIIDACEELYRAESYHDITMTQVASKVSFGRANVYNYFQGKDEILLALLQREHELWAASLVRLEERGPLADADLAEGLAQSVDERVQMLKLLAMNLYDIEQNSRLESLVEFKHTYGAAIQALRSLIATSKPQWDEARMDRFVFAFMPFLHGVYPYAFHSEKQLAAMKEAGITQPGLTIREMVRSMTLKLLQEDWGCRLDAPVIEYQQ